MTSPSSQSKAGTGRRTTQGSTADGGAVRRRIEEVAYSLYLKRGQRQGHDMEDWLEAERIVRDESTIASSTGSKQAAVQALRPRAASSSGRSRPAGESSRPRSRPVR